MKAKAELRQRARQQAQIQKEHEQTADELAPDTAIAQQYFNKILRDGVFTPHQASIGTPEFDDRQRQNLCDLLAYTLDGRRGKKDFVLELMAGDGRNYPTLRRKFKHVEMLEQAEAMTTYYQSDIVKHTVSIQDFKWPPHVYDTIVGSWVLGYLNKGDREDTITRIHRALMEDGYHVVFEAVT